MGWFFELLHSKETLLDKNYFNLNIGINYERFLANIDSKVYQVDPLVYILNDILYITFELIDFNTGYPLQRYEVFGKNNNYNVLPVTTYNYFYNHEKISTNNNLPTIIFEDVICFLKDLLGYKLDESDSS